ncbi:hypothetical protein SETIT_2G402200v2 [Setaria italica]|uniref:Uncharacterized protein n=1 Tax=Setaria italica TaxID=4555 RepID=A0A368Q8F3_SETIT|nr:hypothetical protein SETIT_2G402200v2 [Setaria italica]
MGLPGLRGHGNEYTYTLCKALRDLLPAYRCITRVQLGNGHTTDFWEDIWEGEVSMSNAFPALYSHVIKPGATVNEIADQGLLSSLAPRLSSQATRELQAVEELLADLVLTEEEDVRTSCFESGEHHLHSSQIYRASVHRTEMTAICSNSSGAAMPHPASSSLVGSWC